MSWSTTPDGKLNKTVKIQEMMCMLSSIFTEVLVGVEGICLKPSPCEGSG